MTAASSSEIEFVAVPIYTGVTYLVVWCQGPARPLPKMLTGMMQKSATQDGGVGRLEDIVVVQDLRRNKTQKIQNVHKIQDFQAEVGSAYMT